MILKGALHNYSTTPPRKSFSRLVNKLLKLKHLVFLLIKLRLQNGELARFWTYLSGSSSRLGIINLPQSLLCILMELGGLPPARSEPQLQLYAYLTTIQFESNQDYYEWEINGQTSSIFKTRDFYDYLREPQPDVIWAYAVWFSRAILGHSFHSWLVIQERIPTRDRLIRLGIQTDDCCILCNPTRESRDHLYFYCMYSYDLWKMVIRRLRLIHQRAWTDTFAQMTTLPPPNSERNLTLLAWQATMYWLLHANTFSSSDQIFKLMDHQLRNKIQSFRETNPTRSSQMMQRWIRLDWLPSSPSTFLHRL